MTNKEKYYSLKRIRVVSSWLWSGDITISDAYTDNHTKALDIDITLAQAEKLLVDLQRAINSTKEKIAELDAMMSSEENDKQNGD